MKNLLHTFAIHRQRVLALTLVAALGLPACQVTDLQPKDELPEAAIYTNPARISLAVTGVYNAAQSGFYDPLNGSALAVRGYPFGAASAALGDARGEDVTDMLGFFGLVYQNLITTATPNAVNMWSNSYALINQANVTIVGVQSAAKAGVITTAAANIYEGELRFLRAFAHHELVINFSKPYADGNGSNLGVPYRDFPVNTTQGIAQAKVQDRGKVADDYTKILADLDFAEANLPATRDATLSQFASVTRATKGAAIALKQRVRLHQANWAAAITEGNKLIQGTATFTSPIGAYSLMPTQKAAFPGGAATTAENIFSVENNSTDNPGQNGSLPKVFGATAIGGRALLGVSPILYNAPFFTCNDLRRASMQTSGRTYVITKYTDAANQTDFNSIIRYAEVILNQAEAVARTGTNDALALSLLNAIRNRSVAAADRYSAGALTGKALVQAILNERRIEFVGEGKRWGDLSRLAVDADYAPIQGGGIPAKFYGNLGASQIALTRYGCGNQSLLTTPPPIVGAIPYNTQFFLWPIPALETQINPTLAAQQNPGY
ncbi:hypothetical protein A0257_09860 [Hymenobacter psoromatis]|nr:hypothetical protein A0257_09860 [Hymenobacter psoromatis]